MSNQTNPILAKMGVKKINYDGTKPFWNPVLEKNKTCDGTKPILNFRQEWIPAGA